CANERSAILEPLPCYDPARLRTTPLCAPCPSACAKRRPTSAWPGTRTRRSVRVSARSPPRHCARRRGLDIDRIYLLPAGEDPLLFTPDDARDLDAAHELGALVVLAHRIAGDRRREKNGAVIAARPKAARLEPPAPALSARRAVRRAPEPRRARPA